jgi:hypothetical protein
LNDTLFTEQAFGPFLLLELALAKFIGSPRLAGELLGVFDQTKSLVRSQLLDEIHPTNLENAIDEFLKLCSSRQRQVPLENDPVKTRKHANDETGEFRHKATYWFHGILLPRGCRLTTMMEGRVPFF